MQLAWMSIELAHLTKPLFSMLLVVEKWEPEILLMADCPHLSLVRKACELNIILTTWYQSKNYSHS